MKNSASNHLNDEEQFLNGLSSKTVQILIAATVGTFLFTACLQFFFYKEVFSEIAGSLGFAFAVAIAAITQTIRFGLVIAGASDFAKGRQNRGIFSLLCSLGVTIFCGYEIAELAYTWGQDYPRYAQAMLLIFEFMVWAGFALEIRLIVSVANSKTATNDILDFSREGDKSPNPLHTGNGITH